MSKNNIRQMFMLEMFGHELSNQEIMHLNALVQTSAEHKMDKVEIPQHTFDVIVDKLKRAYAR